MIINYDQSNETVDRLRKQGIECYWVGYAIHVFKPHTGAMRNSKGVLRNGRWGYEDVYDIQSDGTWQLPDHYFSNKQ